MSREDIVQGNGPGIVIMAVASLQWKGCPTSGQIVDRLSASQDPAWNALLACFVTDGHRDNLIKVHMRATIRPSIWP